MSKAFSKDEGEGSEAAGIDLDPLADLPVGAKNYMTRQGYDSLKSELQDLAQASGTVAVRRARFIAKVLESAEVVDVKAHEDGRVLFGAEVTVEGEHSGERTYRIVGIHEADPKAGKISWTSPVAKALLNKHVGDEAVLRTPSGEEPIEILSVKY